MSTPVIFSRIFPSLFAPNFNITNLYQKNIYVIFCNFGLFFNVLSIIYAKISFSLFDNIVGAMSEGRRDWLARGANWQLALVIPSVLPIGSFRQLVDATYELNIIAPVTIRARRLKTKKKKKKTVKNNFFS